MIKWSDDYSVFYKTIDNQHKKILQELNNLLKLIKLNKSVHDIKLAADILEEVVDTHFITEERLMKQHNYHDFKNHVKEHKIFKNNIQMLKKALIQYGLSPKLTEMINSEILEWNTKHIKVYDKKLGDFLRIKGA